MDDGFMFSHISLFLFQYNMDGSSVNEETVGHLRQRLNVMREICKVREHNEEDDVF